MATEFPEKYEVYTYQSDLGYKGAGTFGSKEGINADIAGNQNLSGEAASKNFAKEGSFLYKLLEKEFPKLKAEKLARSRPARPPVALP